MKITDKRNPILTRFENLAAGLTFDWCGDIAIKTADGNAYCLTDGHKAMVKPQDLIQPVYAEVNLV